MFTHKFESEPSRRHVVPAAWGAGAVASVVLVLGVNGTLSSWTQAVINNDTNTTKSALAVALSETDGTLTCDTAATTTNSVVSCAIDKFGGTTTPLSPGDSTTVDVTFTNTGTGPAATLALAPGTCDDGTGSLCSDGSLTTAVSCSDGATFAPASAWTDLVWTAAAPSTQATDTHTATIASGAQATCRFTVALASTAPASVSDQTLSQPLTWTLTKS